MVELLRGIAPLVDGLKAVSNADGEVADAAFGGAYRYIADMSAFKAGQLTVAAQQPLNPPQLTCSKPSRAHLPTS